MTPDHHRRVLVAIARYAGMEVGEVAVRENIDEGRTRIADTYEVKRAIADVLRRVRLAPLVFEDKQDLITDLRALAADPPEATEGEIRAWSRMIREFPPRMAEVQRDPVILPVMTHAQHDAWATLLDLPKDDSGPWCLIGGQMVTLHCMEHDRIAPRATEDADVVVNVWLVRRALQRTSALLQERGFAEESTSDGYGYRYRRGTAVIDILVPEGISTQREPPQTATGRRGFEVPGGNQALIRTERVPVRLGDLVGHVQRPHLLGALVAKAAAVRADTRETDRHREDIAVLGQVALDAGMFRQMARMCRRHDRQRLRFALATMPTAHRAWLNADEPDQVRAALNRLALSASA